MWDEEEYPSQQNPAQQPQQMMEPPIDPQELERIRQEVEMAHEEFQRLLSGKRRHYTSFRY